CRKSDVITAGVRETDGINLSAGLQRAAVEDHVVRLKAAGRGAKSIICGKLKYAARDRCAAAIAVGGRKLHGARAAHAEPAGAGDWSPNIEINARRAVVDVEGLVSRRKRYAACLGECASGANHGSASAAGLCECRAS